MRSAGCSSTRSRQRGWRCGTAKATRSTWPSGRRSRSATPRWPSNTDQSPPYSAALRFFMARTSWDALWKRLREPDHLGGKGERRLRGNEVATREHAELGAKELRERAGDGVDGQVAVRFAPQHQRGHARRAKRLDARSGLARIESARCPDQSQPAFLSLVGREHRADRFLGQPRAAHLPSENRREPGRVARLPALDALHPIHRPLTGVHAVRDDEPPRAPGIGGDQDLRRGRSHVVGDDERRFDAERVEELGEPSRLETPIDRSRPGPERCTAARRRGAPGSRRPRAGWWWGTRAAGAPAVPGPRRALPAPDRPAARGPWAPPADASFWHVTVAIWLPGPRSCCADRFAAVACAQDRNTGRGRLF